MREESARVRRDSHNEIDLGRDMLEEAVGVVAADY